MEKSKKSKKSKYNKTRRIFNGGYGNNKQINNQNNKKVSTLQKKQQELKKMKQRVDKLESFTIIFKKLKDIYKTLENENKDIFKKETNKLLDFINNKSI